MGCLRMKLMVIGYKEHGKDKFCEILREKFQITFASSSETANELFMFDLLKNEYGYATKEECFIDRRRDSDMRERWYLEICSFVKDDLARLGRHIFAHNDIYCGCRDKDEFLAMKKAGMIDLTVWIDASSRKPPESAKSMKLSMEDADIVIDNNGTLKELEERAIAFYEQHVKKYIH